MKRREFLRTTGIVSAGLAFPSASKLFASDATSGGWRTFEVATRVEVLKSPGITRIWVPAALNGSNPFQKTLANTFTAEGGSAKLFETKPDGMGIIAAEFPAGVTPVLNVTSRVATRDYAVDLSAHGKPQKENKATLQYFLQPSSFVPTDGIVKQKSDEITKGASSDVEKARAIYEWIVINTFRNPKTRGCGKGDIRFMLETGDFGGKCADLNALYVGTGARGRTSRARRLRHPRRQISVGLQEPGRVVGKRDQGAALPRGSASRRIRLGACRSRRRAQGRAGRAAGKSSA